MDEVIFLVEEAPEGCYTARALGHSIFTEADDAEQLHFDPDKRPKIVRLHSDIWI